jgi:hypothetical protein
MLISNNGNKPLGNGGNSLLGGGGNNPLGGGGSKYPTDQNPRPYATRLTGTWIRPT